MNNHNFEELRIWQRSKDMAVNIVKEMSSDRYHSLKDQVQRSAVSVPSNIAEGAERTSNREFSRFLDISLGSNGELRTQLIIGKESGLWEESMVDPWIKETKELSAMIRGFSKSLNL